MPDELQGQAPRQVGPGQACAQAGANGAMTDGPHYPIVAGLDPMSAGPADVMRVVYCAFAVAAAWGLTDLQCARALGYPDPGVVAEYWRDGLAVPGATITSARAVYLVGIHQAGVILFRSEEPRSWAQRPMGFAGFNNRSVAEIVATGEVQQLEMVARTIAYGAGEW